ncbi:MAG: hypothetical protein SGJ20_01890 [Planctomycetota bacterium]|nr:hypothetical protein [Planctomycetota bacterium]
MKLIFPAILFATCWSISPCWGETAAQSAPPATPTPPVQAGTDKVSMEQLADQIRGAGSQYRPVTEADVATARRTLLAEVKKLDQRLSKAGKSGADWRRFLRWSQMQQQLAAGNEADTERLDEIAVLYRTGYPGLELPVVANVGRALQKFNNRLATFKDEEADKHYQSRLDALADEVTALAKVPAMYDSTRASLILNELLVSGQAPELVRNVRRHIHYPNLHVGINPSILAVGINDPINEVSKVQDVILGTRISGTARTIGQLDTKVRESYQNATIDLNLLATAHSRTVGRNGPAVVHSTGVTKLSGVKRIILDPNGFRGIPAVSTAATKTTFTCIAVTSKLFRNLIQQIATKKAYQSKPQAERIAAAHAQTRLNNRLNEQAAKFLAEANRGFVTRFRNPLLRFGVFPDDLLFRSSANKIQISATQADPGQIGATTVAPSLPQPADISLRVHQSLINNLATSALGGRRLYKDEVNQLLVDLTGKVPEELEDSEEDRDWSIVFPYQKPIEVTFDDDGFVFTLRGEEYTSGDSAFPAMNVTARYKLEKGPNGIRAIRQGALEIAPPDFVEGEDRLSTTETSVKRILTRRFDKIFKPEIVSKGIQLKGRWQRLGKINLTQLKFNDGWASLCWDSVPAAAPATTASAGPTGAAEPTGAVRPEVIGVGSTIGTESTPTFARTSAISVSAPPAR